MADDVDSTEERMEFDNSITVKNVCEKASKMLKGEPGECHFCGEIFTRVIHVEQHGDYYKSCGRCRDALKLD